MFNTNTPFKPNLNPDFLELIQSDRNFHQEICSLFESDCKNLIQDMYTALEKTDGDALYQAAHALKGIFSNTGFDDLKSIVTPMMACQEPALLERMKKRFGEDLSHLEQCYLLALNYLKSLYPI